ncbi:MAG: sarcosine oxidase subunit gamma [Solirubrobacterales bacterium]|nr:sarcosine oxidase subunit gamma [Solirubrobacterales bacterium]
MRFLTIPTDGAPAARSPMERAARALGARMQPRAGALVVVGYGDGPAEHRRIVETVAFADASHVGVLELQTPPARSRALVDAVAAVAPDATLEAGVASRAQDAWWCSMTPGRALVVGAASVLEPLRTALDTPPVRVTDLSAGHAALVVAGPLAREVIARFCALDLRPSRTPVHACRPGSIARTGGMVIREAEDRYLLLFGAAYGAYLWSVVADAAEHLGGGPVGLDALDALDAVTPYA